jgi:hypothetical protein
VRDQIRLAVAKRAQHDCFGALRHSVQDSDAALVSAACR